MKLPVACLCLSLLIPGALSNVLAGPFQSVLLWYAYQMDISVNGGKAVTIAPGCKGTGLGGTCFFDEFLKYIQRTGPNVPAWTGSTGIGTDLEPDPVTAAQAVSRSGYSNTIEPSQLLPKTWNVKGVSPSFSAVFGAVVDSIQAARQTGKDLGNSLTNARTAIVSVVDARLEDQAQNLISGLNQKLSSIGVTWTAETRTATGPGGASWLEVDTQGTINAHPGEAPKIYTAIQKFVASFSVSTGKTPAAQHNRAIQACQQLQSRLMGAPTC